MNVLRLRTIIFGLLFFPVYLFAQDGVPANKDITGLWKGSLYSDTMKRNLPYEIAISEEKGKLTGYSYTLFDVDGRQEMGVKKVKIKRKDDQLIIEDVELISNTYSAPPPRNIRMQSIVNLSVQDSSMQLSGNWNTNQTREYLRNTGTLKLERKIEYKTLALFKILGVLKLDNDLSFVKTQKIGTDIAIVDKPVAGINSPVVTSAQPADIDEPKEPVVALPKKSEVVFQNMPVNKTKSTILPVVKSPAYKPVITVPELGNILTRLTINDLTTIKNKPSSELAAIPAYRSKSIITSLTAKRKEVLIAANVIKKEVKQPVPDVAKTVTPPPVTKKQEPVVAVKEPAKKENKPVAEIVKKPATENKPVVTSPPVVTKPAPVITIKEPAKTEGKTEPKKEPAIAAVSMQNVAVNVAERTMKNEQSVFFESDSLVLTLYDNGDVDGDTVSVLMNGQIIFARQGLSTKANSKTIYIDKDMPDTLSMVMYAENLGSIPPNTGLLIIMDGDKRYEVRFSADLKTNAAILLKRRIKGT
ncbi:MAG: hypothetical protein ABIQ31_07595 [Ferruginibacter sp.]